MSPISIRDMENGTAYGKGAVSRMVESDRVPGLTEEHDLVLKTLRILVADLCKQFNGGHPGGAIGMMAIAVTLWKYTMVYAPHQPDWFNRDRFVLSNGHTCLIQYIFLHFTGYRDMTFDQLRSYHSSREDALCPGHPEREHEGVEVTTGPLGQGLANAVGLAMATKHLAARFNQPGFDVVSNHTWCMVGDACLQEGVGLEAISLAGHLRLNNLTIIYDNNQVTCDGSVDMTNTEDVNRKMSACGFNVIDIDDGSHNIECLKRAFRTAKNSTDKPTFINITTIIGLGSAVAGDAVAHGAAFQVEDLRNMKSAYGFDPEKSFTIPETVRQFFADIPERGNRLVREWENLASKYEQAHPDLAASFAQRRGGNLPSNWQSLIPSTFPEKATASRASSGLVLNPIAEKIENFMVGTADPSPSVNMGWSGKEDFQHPSLGTTCGVNGSYTGRYVHYGVREHAMCAISNGLAAFHPGTIIPVTSSFFMFYLYAAPAVRMGALQHLQVIHAATHDSIGMGEDGPTHQPIELAALYRAMPNMLYLRPADSEETAGAWTCAIEAKTRTSIVSTSRHALRQYPGLTKREGVRKGAYVVQEIEGSGKNKADMTMVGVGAEFSIAFEVAAKLREMHGLQVRIVSFPCQRLFEEQSKDYRREVLQRHTGVPCLVVEAYSAIGWERYADAAVCMATKRFGKSLPGPKAYEYFGFTSEKIVPKVMSWLAEVNLDQGVREFVEIFEER